MMQTKTITRHTRAGYKGKDIVCTCGEVHHVYHFAWSGLGCKSCGNMVDKYDFKEVISK